ncbi:MAG: DUF4340 domain-containing protein [Ruminococcus sp.]|nr:DUF4340 domain-containing protein [Ruminococcus sp.]
MKRQLILGLILVLMIFITIGAYFFIDSYQTKQTEEAAKEAAALQISNFSFGNVVKLDIHTPDLDYTIEADDESNSWVVTEGEQSYINTYYINTLCSYGCSLTATEDLGILDSSTLENYGLSDPISIMYYIADSTSTDSDDSSDVNTNTVTIYVGNQTSTSEYFYMMCDGSDHVYLVDASIAGYLAVNETQLRNRYVVEDSTSDFCRLSLQAGDEVIYDLELTDEGEWDMLVPYDIPILLDSSKISSLTISLQEMEIDDFGESDITESDYAEYGFDNPGYTLYFEQKNGNSVTLLFEDYDSLVTSYINCLHMETGEIYIFDSSYLSFLQAETSDYMLETLYKPSEDTVASMTVSYSGSYNDKTLDFETTIDIDYENSTYSCNGIDFSDSEDTVDAYSEFFEKAANLSYEEIQSDAKDPGYDADAVALSITYVLTDDSTHTVELIPYEDNNYWAYIDGEFSYTLVRQKTLSGNGRLLECYVTFEEALESVGA